MAQLIIRLPELMEEWERKHGVKLTITDIHRATGISRDALTRLYKRETSLFAKSVIEDLCQFFDCDTNDLLYIDREAG